MQKITLGTTYYNCPELLLEFVKTNINFVDELIVVDDGSSRPIQNILSPSNNLKLYRVREDIGFNSHGCRNLIMKESSNDWVVMIDIDRSFQEPKYAFDAIKHKKLISKVRYLFMVHAPVWGENMHSSVNDYLIHRDHFFSAGGYDEEIVGQRWGDREFFKQLLATSGKELTMYDINLKHTRPSTALLSSKYSLMSSSNPASHQELIQQRIKNPDKHKPILRFEWDRLL